MNVHTFIGQMSESVKGSPPRRYAATVAIKQVVSTKFFPEVCRLFPPTLYTCLRWKEEPRPECRLLNCQFTSWEGPKLNEGVIFTQKEAKCNLTTLESTNLPKNRAKFRRFLWIFHAKTALFHPKPASHDLFVARSRPVSSANRIASQLHLFSLTQPVVSKSTRPSGNSISTRFASRSILRR